MIGKRENDLLRRALALYAGEHVLSRVEAEGEHFLSRNGQRVVLTMLFYDIASFREVLPGVTSETLRDWSAEFSETMTGVVAKSSGTFDTFIGDAGSAWWGDDGAVDHPARAVTCARQMLHAIEQLNTRMSGTFPSVGLMIGVHTGVVTLGNIGSSSRLRYCPMGDAVNIASRVCGLSNHYRRPAIISQTTYDRLPDRTNIEFLEAVRAKGHSDPLRLYGLAEA
jgi:adenylate cyclase